MKYEEANKFINSVIENEFQHVQHYEEKGFSDTDEVFEKLLKSIPEEYRKLIDEYSSAACHEWVNLCRFYFKKGVIAGTTNLNFLKDTNMMEYIE